jgi:hypothetical protein
MLTSAFAQYETDTGGQWRRTNVTRATASVWFESETTTVDIDHAG